MSRCFFCPTKAPPGRLPSGWSTLILRNKTGKVLLESLACPKCSALLPPRPPRRYELIGFDERTCQVKPHGSSAGKIYLPAGWIGGEVACILTRRPSGVVPSGDTAGGMKER